MPGTANDLRYTRSLAVFVLILVGLIAVLTMRQALLGYQSFEEPAQNWVELKINPNTAKWQDFAVLPRIGETLARRIVEYRERMREQGIDPVFLEAQDLANVSGIGPQTVAEIEPYLTFAE